jgi:hypothetical protein
MVDGKKAQIMLTKIEEERIGPPKELSKFGRDSWFSNGEDSCFTWAREKLEMVDIHLGKSIFGKIVTRAKNYTALPETYLDQPVYPQI